jgi:nitrogen fixation/metabolism regulation signal transduction histidine kinase
VGNINAKKQARLAQDEMALRMDLERQVDILSRENDSLKGEAATAKEQLIKEKAASEALKGALVEEQKTSGILKDELDKMTRLKETLEEDLKEALTAKPSEAP